MNRDTFGGAVHGLVKRGTGVGIADHGRAGDSRQDDPPQADWRPACIVPEARSAEGWFFQCLDDYAAQRSNPWKPGQTACTAGQDR